MSRKVLLSIKQDRLFKRNIFPISQFAYVWTATIDWRNTGEYGREDNLTQLRMMRDQYGDIVKLDKIGTRRSLIFLFTPELCEKMYRMEGAWPMRIAMETLHLYRKNREDIYNGQYGLATRSVECFSRNVIIKSEKELSLFFLQDT